MTKNIFREENLPAILNILVGFLVYVAAGTINLESTAPILTEKRSLITSQPINDSVVQDKFMFQITNITQNLAWHNLSITCNFPATTVEGRKVSRPHAIKSIEVTAIPPAAPPDSQPIISADREKGTFVIGNMQPGCSYQIQVITIHNKVDEEPPYLYISCNDTVKVREYGFTDWIHEQYFGLNIVLMFMALFSIAIYFYLLSRDKLTL